MKVLRVAPALIACGLVATALPAQAADPLWLMSAREWRASTPAARQGLVRDYMRTFCARPTMAPGEVILCIERSSRPLAAGDAMFDVASACVLALG